MRDEVDAVLAGLAPRIEELSAKYAVAMGPAVTLTDAGPVLLATAEAAAAAPPTQAATADLGKGREVFNGTCSHCHGPNAVVEDRKINLRRLQLKYGEQMDETYFTTVNNGRTTKGMPAWKDVFQRQDFVDILAYLKTLQEK